MKKMDSRVLIGAALILLGALMLLERLGLFRAAIDIFWGLVFLAGAAYFLYRFVGDPHSHWWAAIPGFALAGLSAESLLPRVLGDWGGVFFLGALGLGFFAVYLSGRDRWWAIIPGGILITLAFVAFLTDRLGVEQSGGFLFIGLGLTFLLVAVLASMRWAYVPGIVLLVLGALVGTIYAGAFDYVWPAALILAGLFLVLQFARKT
jgi:hypothetical protein